MGTLLIATRNRHKVGELKAIVGGDHRWMSLADFPDAPPFREEGATFGENARQKACQVADWLDARPNAMRSGPDDFFVLADDSGLEVDALDGAPGVRSARFAVDDAAFENAADSANNAKLLALLADVPPDRRAARFRCVLALLRRDGSGWSQPLMFEGVCEGQIGLAPRGGEGFGYDPLFVPNGYEQTFAELNADEKNRISHRSRAAEQLREYLRG